MSSTEERCRKLELDLVRERARADQAETALAKAQKLVLKLKADRDLWIDRTAKPIPIKQLQPGATDTEAGDLDHSQQDALSPQIDIDIPSFTASTAPLHSLPLESSPSKTLQDISLMSLPFSSGANNESLISTLNASTPPSIYASSSSPEENTLHIMHPSPPAERIPTESKTYRKRSKSPSPSKKAIKQARLKSEIPLQTNGSLTKPKKGKYSTITKQTIKIPLIPRDVTGQPILPIHSGPNTLHKLGTISDLSAYQTERYIFPIGYESSRTFLSMVDPSKTVKYVCRILDGGEGPLFEIEADDAPDRKVSAGTATGAWGQVFRAAHKLRDRTHSNSVSGPDYYGLNQPSFKALLQELPGANGLPDYVAHEYVETSAKEQRSRGISLSNGSPPQAKSISLPPLLNYGNTTSMPLLQPRNNSFNPFLAHPGLDQAEQGYLDHTANNYSFGLPADPVDQFAPFPNLALPNDTFFSALRRDSFDDWTTQSVVSDVDSFLDPFSFNTQVSDFTNTFP